MKNKEALQFLLSRLTVLDKAVEVLKENKVFASSGDWETHMILHSMRAQIPVWIRSISKTLKGDDNLDLEPTLREMERRARTTLTDTVGSPDELLREYTRSLEELENMAQESLVALQKPRRNSS